VGDNIWLTDGVEAARSIAIGVAQIPFAACVIKTVEL
jgi:hypothetical protein